MCFLKMGHEAPRCLVCLCVDLEILWLLFYGLLLCLTVMFYGLELGDTIGRNPPVGKYFVFLILILMLYFIFCTLKLSWMGDFIDEIDPIHIWGNLIQCTQN